MPSSWLPRTSLVLGPAILVLMAACGENASGPASCSPAVTFAPAEPRLATGDSLALTASLSTSSGCGGVALTWRSSDPATISIEAATGVAHAHQAGSVLLYVTSGASSDAIDSVTAVAYAPLFDRIIYTRSTPGEVVQLWTMNTAGGDLRLAVDSLNWPGHPRVSPDGKSIVFENWADIYVTDAGGGARRRLTTDSVRGLAPWWSSDGEWILFRGSASGHNNQIFRMRADGTELTQLTNDGLGTREGAWSPDGRIVYVRNRAIGLGPIFLEAVVIDSAGVELEILTSGITEFSGRAPAWSPDGKSILFFDADWMITRLTLASLQYDTLSFAEGNREGDWSPDGRSIVFGTGDLWTMDPDGMNKRVLLSDGYNNFEAAWTPARPGPP